MTTDLATPVSVIVERYAARWAIEVAFHNAKNTTGVGEARNRSRNAVERTVPFGLYTQSIVIIWYPRRPPPQRRPRPPRPRTLVHHQATPILPRHDR